MKYELTNQQVQNLQRILADADIKGKDAPAIIDLARALGNPIKEKKKDEEKTIVKKKEESKAEEKETTESVSTEEN